MENKTCFTKLFEKWLKDNGAEILPVTNQYEMIRFKGSEIGVIYTSGKYNSMYAKNAVECFSKKKKWDGKPVNVGRNTNYKKQKMFLLQRDGDKCFLCGEELNEDITLDHLISLSSGGTNLLSNMVLMHERCNRICGNMPLNEKVKLAISNRVFNTSI